MSLKHTVFVVFFLLTALVTSLSAQESLPPNLKPIVPNDAIVPLMRLGYGSVVDIAWSPNGETLAVATSIGMWLYDASDLQSPPVSIHDSVFGARTVTYSPDGRFLAAGGSEVHVWDTNTHALIRTFDANHVVDLAFSPDSSQLIISHGFGATSNDLKIWDIESGREIVTLGEGVFTGLTFSPDGVYIAGIRLSSCCFDTYVWDVAFGETLLEKSMDIQADDDLVAFSPDGQTLVVVDRSGSFSVLDSHTREVIHTVVLDLNLDDLHPAEAAFTLDGDSLVTVSSQGIIRIWEAENYSLTSTIDLNWNPRLARLSPDGKRIAAINWNGSMRVWDTRTGELVNQRENFIAGNPLVDFSPDGTLLASADFYGAIWIWDVASGIPRLTLPRYESPITSLDFNSDGTVLASASRDGTVHLWDITSGERYHTITTDGGGPHITTSIDSQDRLLIADGQLVQLYDLATYKPIAWFHDLNTFSSQFETKEFISAIAFENDRLAVATSVGNIYFWEIGEPVNITRELTHLNIHVMAIYNADNLIFAGENSVVLEWSSSGIRILTPHNSWIYALASYDKVIASAGCAQSEQSFWDGSPVCTGVDLRIGIFNELSGFYDVFSQNFTIVSQANGHTAPIQDIAFNHDGTLLATASDDGTILLWGNPASDE